MISDEILEQFKSRMHIFHSAEDERLKRLRYVVFSLKETTVSLILTQMRKVKSLCLNVQDTFIMNSFNTSSKLSTELNNFGIQNIVMKEDYNDGDDDL